MEQHSIMSLLERRLARHALGLPNFRGRSYRNRFVVSYAPGRTYPAWDRMVDKGWAEQSARVIGGTCWFWLTREGAELALDPGETLDPEDFPA